MTYSVSPVGRWQSLFVLSACLAISSAGLQGCDHDDAGGAIEVSIPQAPPPEAADVQPNIILFLTDDQPLGYLDALPFTEQYIFGQGVAFDQAFVATSLCCPSRASILTGQYTHNHGVLSNSGRGGADDFRANGSEARSFATVLRSAGYRTGFIGKYMNQYPGENPSAPPYVPVGWDEWIAPVDVYPTILPYSQYDYTMIDNGQVVPYGHAEGDYFSDVVTERAATFVSDSLARGTPFFALVSYISPHDPATAAKRHAAFFADTPLEQTPSFNESDISDKPRWLNTRQPLDAATIGKITGLHRSMLRSLISVDEGISKIVGLVASNGMLDRTYFIFTSDNGFHLGEHRIWRDKNTAYEEAIRVPLAIAGPGTGRGITRQQLVVNIDLAPTILQLARVSAPPYVDGRSLVPLLGTNAVSPNWRKRFLVEHYAPTAVEGLKLDNRPDRLEYAAVRSADKLYVEYLYGDFELYDLTADRAELDNAYARADQTVLSELRAQLDRLRFCAGASCVEAEDQ